MGQSVEDGVTARVPEPKEDGRDDLLRRPADVAVDERSPSRANELPVGRRRGEKERERRHRDGEPSGEQRGVGDHDRRRVDECGARRDAPLNRDAPKSSARV